MASTLEENLVPFSSSFISIKLLHHVQSSNLLIIPHVKPELGSPNISIVASGISDVNELKSLLINILVLNSSSRRMFPSALRDTASIGNTNIRN